MRARASWPGEARKEPGPQQPQHPLVAPSDAEGRRVDDHQVVVGAMRIAREAPEVAGEVILRLVRQDSAWSRR